MKAAVVRTYKVVHTWVGIVSGLMLFIAFYAGAFTMFKPEIGRWAAARPTLEQAAVSPIDALSRAFLAARDPSLGSATLVLSTTRPDHGYFRYTDKAGTVWRTTLDESGQLRRTAGQTAPAGKFVDDTHRNGGLPLPDAVAEPIIGIVALLYGVALVSGLVILLPSLVKDLLVLRIGANVKRFWLDAHNLIGITSLPFHLVIALTTAGFCLHDWVYDTQDATIYASAATSTPRPAGKPAASEQWVAPSALLASAVARSDTFTPTELTYRGMNTPKPQVSMAGEDWTGHMRSPRAGYMNFNPADGQRAKGPSLEPHGQSNWEAGLSGIFALHFGSFGGAPVRVAYALMGVLGAILFYTGNLLWIESRLRKQRQAAGADALPLAQPRHVRWVAALTVGLCMGAVIGLPLGLVAMRWHAALGLAGAPPGHALFNTALALGLLLALAKGAHWAGYRLTLAAGAATWLVPATSLLACWPAIAIAKPYEPAFAWIDGLSLLGGTALLVIGLRARKRALAGPPQSVWRVPPAAPAHALPISKQMEQM